MTDGYERIKAHCEWLVLIGMPVQRVMRLEADMVRAWSAMVRERRAAETMGATGASQAAATLGIHRSTVYRRAQKSQELRKRATA